MMEKRRRGSCSKKDRKVMFETDRISILPDELLVFILSLLTLKESTATSLLSRRWRYLWTLVPKLDFDCTKSLSNVGMTKIPEFATHEERLKYVRWVDHVIALHKSCVIEDFRVYFNLTKYNARYIDNWVSFALARKVKRLELDLTDIHEMYSPHPTQYAYSFPYKFMHQYKENCSKKFNSIHFKYLEKISLTRVDVNGEALEFFLSNCPLLQHLSVSKSRELSTLNIIGPFPSLKHLEIIWCNNLNSFEVRDANLVYLKYMGNSIQQFVLKNVPLLVEVYISGLKEMRHVLSMFSGVLPQLEKFYFQIDFWLRWEVSEMFYSAVEMSNLKQLVLKTSYDQSLRSLANILRASPFLETFVLEITRFPTRYDRKRELYKMEGSYAYLKEVQIRGYEGTVVDLEIVMHLLESAGALEKIVVDPHKPLNIHEYFRMNNNIQYKGTYMRRERNARSRAKKELLGKVPPTINLHIL